MARRHLLSALFLLPFLAAPRGAAEEQRPANDKGAAAATASEARAAAAPVPKAPETPPPAGPDAETAATVNGEPIPYKAFVEGLIRLHGRDYLDELITDAILRQEFRKQGITAAAAEVEDRIQRDATREIAARQKAAEQSGQSLAEILRSQGSSIEKLERDLIARRKEHWDDMEKMVKTDKLVAYFLLGRERVRVRQILVATRQEALDLLKVIDDPNSGQTFDSIANAPPAGTKLLNNAVLGPFARDDYKLQNVRPELAAFGEAFTNTAFSLKEGDHSGAFGTHEGYHVIKLVKRYPALQGSYETLKNKVAAILESEDGLTAADRRTWMTLKRAETSIEPSKKLLEIFER